VFPYFGIVPRALMQEAAGLACEEWLAIAGGLEAKRRGLPVEHGARIGQWHTHHDDHDVASWQACRDACTRYLERLLRDSTLRSLMPGLPPRDAPWQLWQIKEGHTTSVWRASALAGDARQALCINVARDRSASLELQCCAELLMRWRKRDSVHIAPLHRIDCIEVREGLRGFGLTATAGAWIEGRELHVEQEHARLQIIEVDRFVCDGRCRPQLMAGRRLSTDDTRDLLQQWRRLVIRHAAACPGQPTVLAPRFDFEDGDLVRAGRRLIAIACGADRLAVPAAAWSTFVRVVDPLDAYRFLHGMRVDPAMA
jgi:hypothetical protein